MSFSEMLGEIYKIWDGGIVLYGSVIGGAGRLRLRLCLHLPQVSVVHAEAGRHPCASRSRSECAWVASVLA